MYEKRRPTKYFRKYADLAGLRPELHLHCLRHTAAVNMLEHNVNVNLISDVLGHAEIKTTMIYLDSFPEVLRPAFQATSIERFLGPKKSDNEGDSASSI